MALFGFLRRRHAAMLEPLAMLLMMRRYATLPRYYADAYACAAAVALFSHTRDYAAAYAPIMPLFAARHFICFRCCATFLILRMPSKLQRRYALFCRYADAAPPCRASWRYARRHRC